MASKAVFLDRDHTIIDDPGYLSDSRQVTLLPEVDGALKSLACAGYKLVVVTNQSGVARGLVTEQQLAAVHEEMQRQLLDRGVRLDGIYYCPYHPEGVVEGYVGESDERKPNPGMILRAAREMDIDLSASWMVGDKPGDVQAGQRAGCRTIQVMHNGRPVSTDPRPDFTAHDLSESARIILGESRTTPAMAETSKAPTPSPTPAEPRSVETASRKPVAGLTDSEVLHELLQHARQLARTQHEHEFSVSRLIGSIAQVLAGLALLMVLINFGGMGSPQADLDKFYLAIGWIGIAGVLQLVALTFLLLSRRS